jgi:predicted heme/steroid binding protein
MGKFTREELARCDGENGAPTYSPYEGKVYNASRSFQWQRDRHPVRHPVGVAYSGELDDAPHGVDLLERLPVIGELVEGS